MKAGTKKVEGRTPTIWDKTPYENIHAGDTIKFTNNKTDEHITVTVRFIHHYSDVKHMLEAEGTENVLSSEPRTVKHGIESYNKIQDYKDSIKKNGIYAIGIKVI